MLHRAQAEGIIKITITNLRDFGLGRHRQVDDTPYGGGSGMLLRPDVVVPAILATSRASRTRPRVILLSPQGRRFTQATAERLALEKRLILVAGHYEGFDERISDYVDETISLGDFVLTGGELPAAVLVDAVARLVPGVLREGAAADESHSAADTNNEIRLLEYPQYTKPPLFEGKAVPEVLLSGDHAAIERWRRDRRRPIPKHLKERLDRPADRS